MSDTQTLVAQIRQAPLFASLPAAAMANLAAIAEPVTLPPGIVLFQENEPGNCLYIVLAGELEVVKAIGTEHERLLTVSMPGDVVGEMSLLTPGVRRSATVRVRSEASLLAITRSDFEALMQRYPKVALDVICILSARLRDADNAIISELREKNAELSQAYADLASAQQQIIEQETLKRELERAYEIQQAMLPAALPHLAAVDTGAQMLPARMVGGDFYDVIHFPEANRLVFLVGDVSGKGIPAALFMALSSSLLRAAAARSTDPIDVLRTVNRQLLMRRMKSMFVTVYYGCLDLDTRELCFVRAGHEFPLMWDVAGGPLPTLDGRSQPLGLFADPVLDGQSLILAPNTTLLLYTDGATEAMDAAQNLFGRERLFAAARASRGLSAQALCDHLAQVVTDYQAAATQADDITFLALRVS